MPNNLVEALRPRVEAMMYSISYRMKASGQYGGAWSDFAAPEHLVGELTSESTIRWHRKETLSGRSRAVVITDKIRVTNLLNQTFGPEAILDENKQERYHQNLRVDEGAVFDDTVSHTFSQLTTREDAYKQGLEVLAKQSVRVGAGSTVTGVAGTFDFQEKFTADFEQRYGSQTKNEDTISRHLEITGPWAGVYEFVRSRNRVQQRVTAQNDYEFSITVVDETQIQNDWGPAANWWNDVFSGGNRGYHNNYQFSWDSFAQFLTVAKDQAPTTYTWYDLYHAFPETDPYWLGILEGPLGESSFLMEFDDVQSADVQVRKSVRVVELTPATPKRRGRKA